MGSAQGGRTAHFGRHAHHLAHGVDVTERQQAEARDRFLILLEETVRSLSDPVEITAAATTWSGLGMRSMEEIYAAGASSGGVGAEKVVTGANGRP